MMIFERSDDSTDPAAWHPISPEAAHRQLGLYYLDGGERIIAELEASARDRAPEPGNCVFMPLGAYRARVAEDYHPIEQEVSE